MTETKMATSSGCVVWCITIGNPLGQSRRLWQGATAFPHGVECQPTLKTGEEIRLETLNNS